MVAGRAGHSRRRRSRHSGSVLACGGRRALNGESLFETMLKGVVGRYFDSKNLRRSQISADIGGFGEWRCRGTCRLSGQDPWAMQRAQGLQVETCVEELTLLLSDTGIDQPLRMSEDSLRLQVANITRLRTEHLVRHAKTDRSNWGGSRSSVQESATPLQNEVSDSALPQPVER